ncbi:hypothetical protein EC970259_A0129 [Escherichia coli 99.0741]|nr:hypothetical protein EC970259_A0129 [Escherichia coli 99.0741]
MTWELILDGYSESSYSATPRFAAARLPWFWRLRFCLQITFNRIAGDPQFSGNRPATHSLLVQDFNFHNCFKSDHKLS